MVSLLLTPSDNCNVCIIFHISVGPLATEGQRIRSYFMLISSNGILRPLWIPYSHGRGTYLSQTTPSGLMRGSDPKTPHIPYPVLSHIFLLTMGKIHIGTNFFGANPSRTRAFMVASTISIASIYFAAMAAHHPVPYFTKWAQCYA